MKIIRIIEFVLFLFLVYNYSKVYSYDIIEDNSVEEVSSYNNSNNIMMRLADIFLFGQEKLVNHPFVNLDLGYCNSYLPKKIQILESDNVVNNISKNNISKTNSLNVEYGFIRLDTNEFYENLTAYSSEFAYIEFNTNKYFLFDNKLKNNLYDNEFSFGVGRRTGMSQNILNRELYFLHTGAFLWTYFDYDGYMENKFFRAFDENYKFGFRTIASAELRLSKYCILGTGYEQDNVYSGFEFGKWFGSWLIDNVLQRWIDFYEPVLVKEIGNVYPLLSFLYKSTVSFALSEIRKNKQYYPFNSDYSLLQRKLNINIKLVF